MNIMKKIFLFSLATCCLLLFVSCEKDSYERESVLINGVRWATRNVDAPGTFTAQPEDFGTHYQWNRKVGWSASDPMINSDGGTTWESFVDDLCDTWAESNDPSPSGWRIPTQDELKSLLDTSKVSNEWTSLNEVTGRRFTDRYSGKSIFLPAAGMREYQEGYLNFFWGTVGAYWSSTSYQPGQWAYYIRIDIYRGNVRYPYITNISNAMGMSVRPVLARK